MSVPTISVTVEMPASEAGRVATAFCARRNYGPSGVEDAVRYVRETILAELYRDTLEFEAGLAASAARDAVMANPDDPLAQRPGPEPGPQPPPEDEMPVATGATGGGW
jgi:hypothetical protein